MEMLQQYDSEEDEPPAKRAKVTDKTGSASPASDLRSIVKKTLQQHLERLSSAGTQQGRVRAFPHVEGNYATHVCISVLVDEDTGKALRSILHKACSSIPGLQTGSDALPDNLRMTADLPVLYHLSLSRVVPIRYRDRDSLLSSLRDTLSSLKSFEVGFGGLEAFINDEKTRTFLALSVTDGRRQVCKAISRISQAFAEHGLPQFYKDARPHISIAWMLGDGMAALEAHISASKTDHLGSGIAGREQQWRQKVTKILCNVGQHIFQVWNEEGSDLSLRTM